MRHKRDAPIKLRPTPPAFALNRKRTIISLSQRTLQVCTYRRRPTCSFLWRLIKSIHEFLALRNWCLPARSLNEENWEVEPNHLLTHPNVKMYSVSSYRMLRSHLEWTYNGKLIYIFLPFPAKFH